MGKELAPNFGFESIADPAPAVNKNKLASIGLGAVKRNRLPGRQRGIEIDPWGAKIVVRHGDNRCEGPGLRQTAGCWRGARFWAYCRVPDAFGRLV